MYLSADLGIDPSSADSTSYIDNISEGTYIGVSQENIYIFKMGSSQKNAEDENKRTVIEQRALDGSNVKKVYLDPNIIITSLGFSAYDKENIYFSVTEYFYNEEKIIDAVHKIIALNIKTLKMDTVYQFEKGCYAKIMGIWQNNFIIQMIYPNDKGATSEIVKFNVYTNEIETITALSRGFNRIEIYKDNLYISNNEKELLKKIDLTNGKTEDYSNLFTMEYDKISMDSKIYDDRIMYNIQKGENGEEETLALNLNTMEFEKIDMYIEDDFVFIIGEIQDMFLVSAGQKMVTYMDTAPDKVTKFEAERFIQDVKLIKKSDYWNSNLNFIEIQSEEIIYK